MIRKAKELVGCTVLAKDDVLGKVADLDFDDQAWTVRYLVVAGGDAIGGRRVVLSPIAVTEIDAAKQVIDLKLTAEQVRSSPEVGDALTVSRELEEQYSQYYGWPTYWGGGMLWGNYPTPMAPAAGGYVPPPPVPSADVPTPSEVERKNHLRSAHEVLGYSVEARDGGVGKVADFLIDDGTWTIHHMVVDTTRWLPGGEVIVPPTWVTEVDWTGRRVGVDLTKETIRNSPEPGTDSPGA